MSNSLRERIRTLLGDQDYKLTSNSLTVRLAPSNAVDEVIIRHAGPAWSAEFRHGGKTVWENPEVIGDDSSDALAAALRTSPYRGWSTYNPYRPHELSDSFILDLDGDETVTGSYKLTVTETVVPLPTLSEYRAGSLCEALQHILEDDASLAYSPKAGDDDHPQWAITKPTGTFGQNQVRVAGQPHLTARGRAFRKTGDYTARLAAYEEGRTSGVEVSTDDDGIITVTTTEAGNMTFNVSYGIHLDGDGPNWGIPGSMTRVCRDSSFSYFDSSVSPYFRARVILHPGGIMTRN